MLPIFCYWDRDDTALIAPFLTHWRAAFPDFGVIRDADVLPILQREAPALADLYPALRIPAVRSDLARLAMLLDRGGLYVDCHCGIRDLAGVRAIMSDLQTLDLVVTERDPGKSAGEIPPRLLINGVLAARPGLPVLREILLTAMENLERHLLAHSGIQNAVLPYDIWSMLGAWVLTNLVLEPAADYADFRRPLRGRVRVMKLENAAIGIRKIHRAYDGTARSLHWSVRQQNESLLDPAMIPQLLAARSLGTAPSSPADLP